MWLESWTVVSVTQGQWSVWHNVMSFCTVPKVPDIGKKYVTVNPPSSLPHFWPSPSRSSSGRCPVLTSPRSSCQRASFAYPCTHTRRGGTGNPRDSANQVPDVDPDISAVRVMNGWRGVCGRGLVRECDRWLVEGYGLISGWRLMGFYCTAFLWVFSRHLCIYNFESYTWAYGGLVHRDVGFSKGRWVQLT